jgi:hypothetical protein
MKEYIKIQTKIVEVKKIFCTGWGHYSSGRAPGEQVQDPVLPKTKQNKKVFALVSKTKLWFFCKVQCNK